MMNLDLRELALIAMGLEEVIDSVVRTFSWITLRSAGDRRPPAGNVGAAITHRRRPLTLPFLSIERERLGVRYADVEFEKRG